MPAGLLPSLEDTTTSWLAISREDPLNYLHPINYRWPRGASSNVEAGPAPWVVATAEWARSASWGDAAKTRASATRRGRWRRSAGWLDPAGAAPVGRRARAMDADRRPLGDFVCAMSTLSRAVCTLLVAGYSQGKRSYVMAAWLLARRGGAAWYGRAPGCTRFAVRLSKRPAADLGALLNALQLLAAAAAVMGRTPSSRRCG